MPYLDETLGSAVNESAHPWERREGLPRYAFRAISEEHFQLSLAQGFHASDGRNNWDGQARQSPELWDGEQAPSEGTVAGRWAYLGYLIGCAGGRGRVVKIEVRASDGWRVHPDDEDGFVHTMKPIPIERFVGWSEPILSSSYEVVRDGSCRVHTD